MVRECIRSKILIIIELLKYKKKNIIILFFNRENLGEKIMRINLSRVKTNRQYCAVIGLKEKMFENLLIHFKEAYLETYKNSLRKRLAKELLHRYKIKTERMLLFFTLFCLKNPLMYDVLGLIFNMDASCVKRNQEKGLDILQRTLEKLGVLPKRNILNKEELIGLFVHPDTIIMDVTNYHINRPFNQQIQFGVLLHPQIIIQEK